MLVDVPPEVAVKALIKALGKGVLKVMSKMGVSTVASYTGAQIFEAIGLSNEVVNRYFTGTTSRLGGVGLDVLAEEVRLRHVKAYPLVVSHPRTDSSRSAASTSGDARESRTCSTRRRSSASSIPPAPASTTSSRSTPSGSTSRQNG